MSALHLWRFDWAPELRELVRREAAALGAGREVAPGLFVGSTPFDPARGGFSLGGGELVGDVAPRTSLDLPPQTRVRVVRGPWKASGNPVDFLAHLAPGLVPGGPGGELELYAAAERWYLVRTPPGGPWRFSSPDLPYRTSTSLASQLARAVVNLVARPGERVLDPVCGTGVMLVEAARLGCSIVGGDLSVKACGMARANLLALELEGTIHQRDALSDHGQAPADVLIGDLPYGRRLAPCDLQPFARVLPTLARRWALVADVDLSPALSAAGHPPDYTVRVAKPTFARTVCVGGTTGSEGPR